MQVAQLLEVGREGVDESGEGTVGEDEEPPPEVEGDLLGGLLREVEGAVEVEEDEEASGSAGYEGLEGSQWMGLGPSWR